VGLAEGEPALSVTALTFTPPPVSGPSAGDAGLLGAESEGGTSYLPWAALAAAVALSVVFGARLARARARN
jgi:hypothetical protein